MRGDPIITPAERATLRKEAGEQVTTTGEYIEWLEEQVILARRDLARQGNTATSGMCGV